MHLAKVVSTMKSKRGSTMVEAAVVFPLVILSIVSVAYMMIGMFQIVSEISMFHTALREEAGLLTQTYEISPKSVRDYDFSGRSDRVSSKTEVRFRRGALLDEGIFEMEGYAYRIKEEDYIRKCDYARYE